MVNIFLSEKDFEQELQALIKSFFPGQSGCFFYGEKYFSWLDGAGGADGGQGARDLYLDYFVHSVPAGGDHLELGRDDPEPGRDDISIWILLKKEKVLVAVCFRDSLQKKEWTAPQEEGDFHKHPDGSPHPYRRMYKNQLKRLLFLLLEAGSGAFREAGIRTSIPAWGTMTGIRPARNAMRQLLGDVPEAEVAAELTDLYLYREDKAALTMEIAKKEASMLRETDLAGSYSLYIGIPFCPTTCLYCSFPSYPMERFQGLVAEYLEALKKEIAACSRMMQGRTLTSLYLGGGTPTSLSAMQLSDLIRFLKDCFPVDQRTEFTVEAGRPDSITEEKLQLLKELGTGRISVNPQTMQEKTLERIGRRHTVEQTYDVFSLARRMGFENINMDLIMGLPGETAEDFADTLRQVGSLSPDSVTMHSLVVKRASKLREELDAEGLLMEERADRMEQMHQLGRAFAEDHQYQPYYIYCQKNAGEYSGGVSQENIGYARAGKECLYNVLMMEEMQDILALGAGASTKCYDPVQKTVHRIENVKSVTDYIGRIDEICQRKTGQM